MKQLNNFWTRVKDIFGITEEDRWLEPANFLPQDDEDWQTA